MSLGLFFAGLAVEEAEGGVQTKAVAVLGVAVLLGVAALASCCWSG
jgi:hypothetical protein